VIKKVDYTFIKLLSPLDLATILYMLVSGIYICFSKADFNTLLPHFAIRIAILLLIICLCIAADKYKTNKPLLFLKNLYPLLFLGFFYTETHYMKNIIFDTNLDAYFYNAEHSLWNCQPSMEFSKLYHQAWVNELMNIFYFSYYVIIGLSCVVLYLKEAQQSQKAIFIVVLSFYLYYIVFAVFPVVGPQYHILNCGIEQNPPYFFGKLMRYILTDYEKPTGAFPSSHVGIAIIISYITYTHLKKLFFVTLPFVIGICFATVYIKAHYLVDVIAGIVSAPICILLSGKLYTKFLSYNTKL